MKEHEISFLTKKHIFLAILVAKLLDTIFCMNMTMNLLISVVFITFSNPLWTFIIEFCILWG